MSQKRQVIVQILLHRYKKVRHSNVYKLFELWSLSYSCPFRTQLRRLTWLAYTARKGRRRREIQVPAKTESYLNPETLSGTKGSAWRATWLPNAATFLFILGLKCLC